jgi:hypothetical protein
LQESSLGTLITIAEKWIERLKQEATIFYLVLITYTSEVTFKYKSYFKINQT